MSSPIQQSVSLSTMLRRPPDLLSGDQWRAIVDGLSLSPREAQVLHCIFVNERVASIASALNLSESTVNTYRERLFRKVRVASCAQLISHVFALHLQYEQDRALSGLAPTVAR